MVKLTTEDFIKKSNIIHNNYYDYSDSKYIGALRKIDIGCPTHGTFSVEASSHMRGTKCKDCFDDSIKTNNEKFIKQSTIIHGGFYDYSLVEYKKAHSNVVIICPKHGEFKTKAYIHLSGANCKKCYLDKCEDNKIIFKKKFLKKANILHKNKYDYSQMIYNGSVNNINIICPKHGIFKQTPNSHLQGCGCPNCKTSKGENRVRDYLENNNIIYETQKKFNGLKGKNDLMFDFYLPKHNACIEYDGEQHFKVVEFYGGRSGYMKRRHKDKMKNNYCFNNNIRLIRIPYTEFKNIENILIMEIYS